MLSLRWDIEATFINRPNRFLCTAEIDGVEERGDVHVTDTGRMQELLLPGARLRIRRASNPNRKTKWDLLAVQLVAGPNKGEWVLVHSGCHRGLMENLLADPVACPFGAVGSFRAEYSIADAEGTSSKHERTARKGRSGRRGGKRSHLDFFVETKAGDMILVETKSCTCAIDGVARFPDAPTDRGRRHLKTLMRLKKDGLHGRACRAAVVFLIFHPDAKSFAPHGDVDLEFADLLYEAVEQGVEVYPLSFAYDLAGAIRFQGQLSVQPKPSATKSDTARDGAEV
jgi:sugar fermentation stimulation protein A